MRKRFGDGWDKPGEMFEKEIGGIVSDAVEEVVLDAVEEVVSDAVEKADSRYPGGEGKCLKQSYFNKLPLPSKRTLKEHAIRKYTKEKLSVEGLGLKYFCGLHPGLDDPSLRLIVLYKYGFGSLATLRVKFLNTLRTFF